MEPSVTPLISCWTKYSTAVPVLPESQLKLAAESRRYNAGTIVQMRTNQHSD